MYKYLRSGLFVAVCAASAQASADIDFRGFASLGGGIWSEDDSTYGGVDDSFTTDPYTKFALQVKSVLNDRTEVTGQLLARGSNDYQLEAEWAYVTIEVTEAMDFRVGRIRSPFFLYSDFLDVGYAYTWVRPPIELYRLPFTTVEGVDILHNHSLGNWSGSFQFYYGGLTDDTDVDGEKVDIILDEYTGANYNLSNDWMTFRLSYNEAEATLGAPAAAEEFFSTLDGLGFGAVSDQLRIDETKSRFYGAGLNIDVADFLVAAEYTVLDIERQTFVSSDDAWYVMLGKRFGDFTLHVTYTEQSADPDYAVLDLIPDIPQTALLRGGVFEVIDNDQDTAVSLGLRYEYSASSAFKFEITSSTQEVSTILGPQDDDTGTLFAFSYDLVF